MKHSYVLRVTPFPIPIKSRISMMHVTSAPPTCHSLQQFPELKFKYVEEDHPEEFFIPYVWMLTHTRSGLYWPSRNIKLRHSSTETSPVSDLCHLLVVLYLYHPLAPISWTVWHEPINATSVDDSLIKPTCSVIGQRDN